MRVLLPFLAIFLVVFAVPASDLEERAKAVEGRLMAPCCGSLGLPLHYSGPALAMKQEIRDLLAAGKTEQEILQVFVERHGEQILAAPPMRGFGAMAYLLPLLFLILGAGLVAVLVRRWKESPKLEEMARPTEPAPEAYAARVREELRKLG